MIYYGEESRHSHYTQDAIGLQREIHIIIVTQLHMKHHPCSIIWICPILTINKHVFFIFKKKVTSTV